MSHEDRFRDLLGKYVNVDEVRAEAEARYGRLGSGEVLLAIAVRKLAEKFEMEVQELKDQLFVKTTTPEEIDAKLNPVVDLSSARNMKEADANLAEIIPLMDEARKKAAQEDPTITLGEGPDEMDSKTIYLRTKIGVSDIYSIVGLHAIGHAGPYEWDHHHLDGTVERKTSNFMALETWGNEYDDDHNMLGRGSFRLHTSDIEQYAKEMEVEGWERYEGPKRKKDGKA
jgi:hypothetical protein